jgi:PBP1b-binding outer membrane lipoprotein LpoB
MRRSALVAVVAVALIGCASQRPPQDISPAAKAAALERARSDLGCDAAQAEVLEAKPPGASVYDIDRQEYRVAVRGCGKRTEYTVACSKWGNCSALSERAIIERSN